MSKKSISIILMLILTITINGNVFAAPSELSKTQNKKKELQSKINTLNKDIDNIIKKIDINKKNMNKIAKDIKNTQTKLKAVEKKSKEQEDLLAKRIRAMYICGNDSYLEIILNSNDFNDFISRVTIVKRIINFDKDTINKTKKERNNIIKQKEALNNKNNKLAYLKKQNQNTLSKLNTDIKNQNTLLSEVTKKEKSLVAASKAKKYIAINSNSTGGTLSRGSGGAPVSYSKVLNMESTAYCGDGITASGTGTKRNSSGYSTIAVDPRVIPMGSRVYVEGYGYAVAEDTGGAIKGNIIDVFVSSKSEATNWGRRNVKVYILN